MIAQRVILKVTLMCSLSSADLAYADAGFGDFAKVPHRFVTSYAAKERQKFGVISTVRMCG